ncbi:MAG: hypothetical protein HY537_18030 [Deltaproteobacteria bacterium]|nr:hypothetical protein [Deltaproteobacteria bacterium]
MKFILWMSLLLVTACNPFSQHPSTDDTFLRTAPGAFGFTHAITLDGAGYVQWTESSGAISYELYRTERGQTSATLVYAGTDYWFYDSPLENGKTYDFVVMGIGSTGSISSSDSGSNSPEPYSSTVAISPNPAPGTFVVLSATGGDSRITLTWSASQYATSYVVYRGTTSGEYTEQFLDATSPYADTSAVNDNTYYYTVVAVGGSGTQVADNEISATAGARTVLSQ